MGFVRCLQFHIWTIESEKEPSKDAWRKFQKHKSCPSSFTITPTTLFLKKNIRNYWQNEISIQYITATVRYNESDWSYGWNQHIGEVEIETKIRLLDVIAWTILTELICFLMSKISIFILQKMDWPCIYLMRLMKWLTRRMGWSSIWTISAT